MSASRNILNDLLGLAQVAVFHKITPLRIYSSKRRLQWLSREDRMVFEILFPDVKIIELD
jgi:hypothetical protein